MDKKEGEEKKKKKKKSLLCDGAIVVEIIKLEGPGELLLQVSAGGDREGADELLEVDGAILVDVKHVEDIVRKVAGVSKREELLVDLLELGFCEAARGTIYQVQGRNEV